MDSDRVELLAEDVRQFVFQWLDSEPLVRGDEAGWIAAQVEAALRAAIAENEVNS
jgi:hypothetical protein